MDSFYSLDDPDLYTLFLKLIILTEAFKNFITFMFFSLIFLFNNKLLIFTYYVYFKDFLWKFLTLKWVDLYEIFYIRLY